MISFKQFFLEKLSERVYNLSSEEQQEVTKMVDRYEQKFGKQIFRKLSLLKKKPEDFYKKELNKKGKTNEDMFPLGLIAYYDDKDKEKKEIPVYVSFQKDSKDRGLYQRDEDEDGKAYWEAIILYYYKISFTREILEDILVHELIHAKQHYKYPGKNYTKGGKYYWLEPIEVAAYTSNIIKALDDYLQKSTTEEKQKTIELLKKFITKGIVDFGKDTPWFLNDKREFLLSLYNNRNDSKEPRYRREFKRFYKKIFSIYQDLKNNP
jgi:hypothetical protein